MAAKKKDCKQWEYFRLEVPEKELMVKLEKLGAEGWELISIFPAFYTSAYFKREVQ